MKSTGTFYLLAVLLFSSVTLIHGLFIFEKAEDKNCKGNFSGLRSSVNLKENRVGEKVVPKLSEACTCEIDIMFSDESLKTPLTITCFSLIDGNKKQKWYYNESEMEKSLGE